MPTTHLEVVQGTKNNSAGGVPADTGAKTSRSSPKKFLGEGERKHSLERGKTKKARQGGRLKRIKINGESLKGRIGGGETSGDL